MLLHEIFFEKKKIIKDLQRRWKNNFRKNLFLIFNLINVTVFKKFGLLKKKRIYLLYEISYMCINFNQSKFGSKPNFLSSTSFKTFSFRGSRGSKLSNQN